MRSRTNPAAFTVRDLMCADVVTISSGASVRELTELLSYHGIAGVPVVDGSGSVVGVVTATDVIRLAARAEDSPARSAQTQLGPERSEYFASVRVTPQLLRRLPAGVLDGHSVAEIMMPATFSVRESTTVQELARFMVDAGIHRALVMEDGELRGIVTGTDVLRAVAGEPVGPGGGCCIELMPA